MDIIQGKEMASGAAILQGSIPNQIQDDVHVDEIAAKPNDDAALHHQNNAMLNPVTEQEPHSTAEAQMSLPMNFILLMNEGNHLAAGTQEDKTAAMNAPNLHQVNPKNALHNNHSEEHTDSALVSPFQTAPPPRDSTPNFSKPPQIAGNTSSQPRNSSLDSAGSQSRRHHLLRHTLPHEAVGDNAVHHFGVTNVPDALREVQKMSQRDLQQAFERVYNVKSSSNNNNWLRKKLIEGKIAIKSAQTSQSRAW